MPRSSVCLVVCFLALAAGSPASAQMDLELARLQGRWVVTELAEDGQVVAREAIQQFLPGGGQVEIIDNTLVFSSSDGGKSAKTFSIDSTTYPKRFAMTNRGGIDGVGIYQFDQGKLVICLVNPHEAPRPIDFAAPAGSKRILMVLRRPDLNLPPPPLASAPQVAAKEPLPRSVTGSVLTDDQIRQMLVGNWKFNDSYGSMLVVAAADGSYQTFRENNELSRFQQVFTRTPVSTGTWRVEGGQLQMRIGNSTAPDRVGRTVPLFVRSVSDKDFIFVDLLGRVGSAVKVP